MDIFLQKVGTSILIAGMTVANWFGVAPQDYFLPIEKEIETKVIHEYLPAPDPVILGASTDSSDVKALFVTTLASRIASTDTSMTLTSATDKDGNALASSTYGFIIDEGTSVEEFVLADCTATACTNMTRGLSVSTGTTSVSALKFEHRRGAEVKITDAPSLIFATNFLRGKQNVPNVLRYASTVATTTIDDDNKNLVNYELLAYTAFNGAGVINASQTQRGIVEMATDLQVASSTATDTTTAPLAIAASSATSTYNSATAALKVVVTQNNGKIDSNFLPSTIPSTSGNNTWTGINTFSTTTATSTMVGSMPVYWIGKNILVFTANGTFTKPSGINNVCVHVTGGGGGGGGNTTIGQTSGAGAGGGTSFGCYDISATTTIGITVGAGGTAGAGTGGTGGTGGTSYFSTFARATGGNGGDTANGGTGGVGVGGTFNFTGNGGGGIANADSSGGSGGSSFFGGGANPANSDGFPRTGVDGSAYGGGGSGGHSGNGSDTAGGAGASGVVIITW